jgi:NAD+ kinase
VPKVGIIYNDSKPVAKRVALDMKLWLEKRGIQTVMATGNGGILGYGKPDAPVCHTLIES